MTPDERNALAKRLEGYASQRAKVAAKHRGTLPSNWDYADHVAIAGAIDEQVADLKLAAEHLRASPWLPISGTPDTSKAPWDGRMVWIGRHAIGGDSLVAQVWWDVVKGGWSQWTLFDPTHYMPIPPLPTPMGEEADG